jgi:hypothetical protein
METVNGIYSDNFIICAFHTMLMGWPIRMVQIKGHLTCMSAKGNTYNISVGNFVNV